MTERKHNLLNPKASGKPEGDTLNPLRGGLTRVLLAPHPFGPTQKRLARGQWLGPIEGATVCEGPVQGTDDNEVFYIAPNYHLKTVRARIAHSCAPSCAVVSLGEEVFLECTRPITPGEILTVDKTVGGMYSSWLGSCACGTPGCHGVIQNSLSRGPTDQIEDHRGLKDLGARATRQGIDKTKFRAAPKTEPARALVERLVLSEFTPLKDTHNLQQQIKETLIGDADISEESLKRLHAATGTSMESQRNACPSDEVITAWLHLWALNTGVGFDT